MNKDCIIEFAKLYNQGYRLLEIKEVMAELTWDELFQVFEDAVKNRKVKWLKATSIKVWGEIVKLYLAGWPQIAIAEKLKISRPGVWKIVNKFGLSRNDVQDEYVGNDVIPCYRFAWLADDWDHSQKKTLSWEALISKLNYQLSQLH